VTETADVMVVSPHPDDAEFGVAGTVARWVKEGKRVIYVICTNGDKVTSDIAGTFDQKVQALRSHDSQMQESNDPNPERLAKAAL
jgi:LmbE family N-acetylglucosaminyl deacetylase